MSNIHRLNEINRNPNSNPYQHLLPQGHNNIGNIPFFNNSTLIISNFSFKTEVYL